MNPFPSISSWRGALKVQGFGGWALHLRGIQAILASSRADWATSLNSERLWTIPKKRHQGLLTIDYWLQHPPEKRNKHRGSLSRKKHAPNHWGFIPQTSGTNNHSWMTILASYWGPQVHSPTQPSGITEGELNHIASMTRPAATATARRQGLKFTRLNGAGMIPRGMICASWDASHSLSCFVLHCCLLKPPNYLYNYIVIR